MVHVILALLDGRDRLTWTVSVGSTTVRAHQSAAGARKAPVPGEPADHALGRSREAGPRRSTSPPMRPVMSFALTAEQRGDSPPFAPVLDAISVPRLGLGRPKTRPRRVLADKAFASRANRACLRRRSIQAVIPGKKDQRRNSTAKGRLGGRPQRSARRPTKERNTVERTIGRIKRYRAVSTRNDKLAVRYETTIQVAILRDHAPHSGFPMAGAPLSRISRVMRRCYGTGP